MTAELLNEATRQFVSQHAHDDVRRLALRGCKDPGVDITLALQQIQGRQTARRKLPSWAATEGIVYPPHLNMEQCSSELTALYKARIVSSLPAISRLVDLTGGFGVDCAFMARATPQAVYVERDERLWAIATHNFALLGISNVTTRCTDAETFLAADSPAPTLFYIDPARRDAHGGRTYALADCTPNAAALMPALLQKAPCAMLKLSPMLDWRKAVADLLPHSTGEVHIVAVDNECKELVLTLSAATAGDCRQPAATPRLVCANILSRDGSTTIYTPTPHPADTRTQAWTGPLPAYLYEPNAAVMKGGCFRELEADFGIGQLSANSHLFLADRLIDGFPGRHYRIEAACTMNKRELKATLGRLSQACITVRNFPITAEQLRQRLRLADGGTHHIFATTRADGTHTLLLCTP